MLKNFSALAHWLSEQAAAAVLQASIIQTSRRGVEVPRLHGVQRVSQVETFSASGLSLRPASTAHNT